MTAREKAIEAAARAERDYAVDLCGPDVSLPRWHEMTGRMRDNYRADAGRYYAALAPIIESALLDRIERKVRLQGLVDPDSTDAWSNGWEAALDAVLAILTEIRQEG